MKKIEWTTWTVWTVWMLLMSGVSWGQGVEEVKNNTFMVSPRSVAVLFQAGQTTHTMQYTVSAAYFDNGSTGTKTNSITHMGAAAKQRIEVGGLPLVAGKQTVHVYFSRTGDGQTITYDLGILALPDPLDMLIRESPGYAMDWDAITSESAKGMTQTQRDKFNLGVRRFALKFWNEKNQQRRAAIQAQAAKLASDYTDIPTN